MIEAYPDVNKPPWRRGQNYGPRLERRHTRRQAGHACDHIGSVTRRDRWPPGGGHTVPLQRHDAPDG